MHSIHFKVLVHVEYQMVGSWQMSNSSVHSVSRTFSTDQTAGWLFLQSVVKTVNSSSYIQNLYFCYVHIVITFPSSSNLLKNSNTQDAKIRSFSTQIHLYTFSGWQHLIRKQMGLRFKRSEEWIMSEMQQTSFTSFITCCTAKNVTTFLIITRQHVTLWMKRVITTAVAKSIALKLWLFIAVRPAELAPCAATAVYPLHGYLPACNRLLCFSMSNFPQPVYILFECVLN
jgi:hypothetical protein